MASEQGCKVDEAIARFDVDPPGEAYPDVDAYLLARWRGEDGREAAGYRSLTQWFNKRLLKRVYDRHGRKTIGARLESDFEALTGEDDLLREEVLDDLAADGIDYEAVEASMVSWSTMRHHLKDCLDGEKTKPSASGDWERDSIAIARERTAEKVEAALRSLEGKGDLPGASAAEATVQVQVSCPDCAVRVPLNDAIRRGYICRDHLGER